LALTKGNENSVVKYLLGTETRPTDGDYIFTYEPGVTTINITSSNDRIWLLVTAENGTTKWYYWIKVTVTL
jgi:hypothetical protein